MKAIKYLTLAILGFLPSLNSCELEDIELTAVDLVGKWDVSEDSQYFKKSVSGFYRVDIMKDPSDTAYILVKNFYELKDNMRARVDGLDISIPRQRLDGYYVNGFGRVSSGKNKIDWFYYVDFTDGDIDTVSAVYTRVR